MKRKLFFVVFVFAFFVLINSSCKKEALITETPGSNEQVIKDLKAVTDSIVANTDVPGIVALVVDYTKGIDWLYKVGVSDIENNLPMEFNHTFRIGSNSKTMTGTVLLQLVDEGLLTLEDTLSMYFPTYPKSDSITIGMLCNMTSGIYNYSESIDYFTAMVTDPTRIWQPEELIQVAFANDFYFSPGTDFHYSNTNTVILGLLIEKLTGNSLESEINYRIANHLNLNNTALLNSGTNLPGSHGKGYYMGEYVEGADLTEYFDASWSFAAGSAYSTPRELQHYVEALVDGEFLSDSLQNRRLNELISFPNNLAYGYCIFKRGSFFGHNGGVPGFTSSMYHSPAKNCTVIIYFNCQLNEIEPDDLFNRYVSILYGADY